MRIRRNRTTWQTAARRVRERGQAATEYILVIGLVVIPMVIAFNKFQVAVRNALVNMGKLLFGPGV